MSMKQRLGRTQSIWWAVALSIELCLICWTWQHHITLRLAGAAGWSARWGCVQTLLPWHTHCVWHHPKLACSLWERAITVNAQRTRARGRPQGPNSNLKHCCTLHLASLCICTCHHCIYCGITHKRLEIFKAIKTSGFTHPKVNKAPNLFTGYKDRALFYIS